MSEIKEVRAREILDSRGNPTVEVEIFTSGGHMGRAAVPSGASTGAHEAHELRDGDKSRYLGKGVQKAVDHVRTQIGPKLKGRALGDQKSLDTWLCELDGTATKSRLGANALLGVSLAYARASALENRKPLYQWVAQHISHTQKFQLPVPLMNVLNGGAHADNGVDVQEFMIVPVVGSKFSESLRAGAEVFHSLKKILKAKGLSTGVGDEGGVAPALKSNREALDLICKAIEEVGYKLGKDIHLALDVAATELYKNDQYTWEEKQITREKLLSIYGEWMEAYPLVSIEDGFSEDDWDGWAQITKKYGSKLQIVGDDLFVTNPQRIEEGIKKGTANALLVKCNQIGTLTETWNAIAKARSAKFKTVMSHRSGETEDAIISDLAVGMGCEQIKTGSLCRGERTAKYNQLLRIEEELGSAASYPSTF
ncbi:MAG: phosphopyruvate hydratase [Bdellovibrionales bacterium]